MADDTPRISVSRDALRADMAELELRLQAFIKGELSAKANQADVLTLQRDVQALEDARVSRDRGELTQAQYAAIDVRVQAAMNARAETAWSWKERGLATLSALVTVATLILSVVLALHGGFL